MFKSNLYFTTALLGASITAVAQENAIGETVELTPFNVTGETYAFGAQKMIHVTSEDLERLQASSLKDVFSQSPSVMVGGGIPVAQKIYLRGIEDKMLNVSVDGATQAGYLSHHHGQYTIEPELLKYAEAEPGAGSAAVGPGALAGAIRFQTKRANDFLSGEKNTGGFTKASFGSNGDQVKLTGAVFGQINNNLSAIAAYTHTDANDYKAGNGKTVEYTGHKTGRIFLGIDASIDARQSVGFSFEDRKDEGTFRHRPNFEGYFNHPVAPNNPVFMEIGRKTTSFDYTLFSSDQNLDLEAKLYHSDNSIDREGQYEMGYKSLGLDLQNRSQHGEHSIEFGFNYRDDTAYFTGKGQTQGFLPFPLVYETIPDETIEISGLFIQDEWQISEKLQASFGLRFDNYDYADKDGQNFNDTGFSPNLGISYAVTDSLDLNISYSGGFRGVTPIDLITANEGGITNAPDIDPETSQNFEFGFQYDNGQYFVNGTIYRQEINDVIIADGVRDNGGDLEVDGYDFAFGLRHHDLRASIGGSYSNPELNGNPLLDTDFGIGSSYGRTWNANSDYVFSELNVRAGWSINYVESYTESTEPLAHKPSYIVHDFFVQWVTGENENISLTLTIDNAFDKYYFDQASTGYNGTLQRIAGLSEPGRDIKLSASIQF